MVVNKLQSEPKWMDKPFVQTPDRTFITLCLVMLCLQGQCHVTPGAQDTILGNTKQGLV